MGELVFRLKNRNDRDTLDVIGETAAAFIERWNPSFDQIVPVPPSRKRAFQPVVEIAKAISSRLAKRMNPNAIIKTKDTPQLKDVFIYKERLRLLEGAFTVDRDTVRDSRILLVDDLYRSGATATVVARDLLAGGAAAVYMLAMTKTRTKT